LKTLDDARLDSGVLIREEKRNREGKESNSDGKEKGRKRPVGRRRERICCLINLYPLKNKKNSGTVLGSLYWVGEGDLFKERGPRVNRNEERPLIFRKRKRKRGTLSKEGTPASSSGVKCGEKVRGKVG